MGLRPAAGWIASGLLVLAVTAVTFPQIGTALALPGLDAAYYLALNHFPTAGVRIGQDVLFSLGPLGFLDLTLPLGDNLGRALVFWTLVRLGFAAALFFYLHLAHRRSSTPTRIAVGLAAVIYINALNLFPLGLALVFLTGLFLLLYEETTTYRWLFSAVLAAVLALLIKTSYGVPAALAIAGFFVVERCLGERDEFSWLVGLGFGVVGLAAIWLLVGNDLTDLARYLRAVLEFSSGNSSAMTLNPDLGWPWLAGSLAALLAAGLLWAGRRGRLALSMYLLPLWAAFKYGASRADHLPQTAFFLILLAGLVLLLAENLKRLVPTAAVLAVSIALFSGGFSHLDYPSVKNFALAGLAKGAVEFRGIARLRESVFGFARYRERLAERQRAALTGLRLPEGARAYVGDASIDGYPWETGYLVAGRFNWRPRPVFQSYIAYTPWLDTQNARFFRSSSAPEFILWDRVRLSSIDGRYLLSDEPKTVYEILRHYSVGNWVGRFKVTLKRTDRPRLGLPQEVGRLSPAWGEWVEVPAKDGFITLASIDFKRTLWGLVQRWVYKEFEIVVQAELADGRMVSHRIVPDNAPSGLWISPYLERLGLKGLYAGGVRVKRIRLLNANRRFEPRFELAWRLVEIKEGA